MSGTTTKTSFTDGNGHTYTLKDFEGQVVLINFWATWCYPCVKEMTDFDRLAAHFKGKPFKIITLSHDNKGFPVVESFFKQKNITHLDPYFDKGALLSHAFQIRGLPTTILLDARGRELGRMEGPAPWDSPEAIDLIQKALKKSGRALKKPRKA